MEFKPVKEINNYVLRYPIHAWGWIGLEIVAYDKMSDAGNFYGISLLEMKVDKKTVFTHDIQKIGFDENPYINAHIDYELAHKQKTFFQKCYVADGNELKTYKVDKENGKIFINDTLMHDVSVKIVDAYRNFVTLNFKIKGTKNQMAWTQSPKSKRPKRVIPYLRHQEFENILKIECLGNSENTASLFFKSKKLILDQAYIKNNEQVFLWDLRMGLPDSVVAGKLTHYFTFKEIIPINLSINYSSPYVDILFPRKSVFDTLFLDIDYFDEVFTIHRPTIPLFSPVSITLKPDFEVINKEKAAVYNLDYKKRSRFAGGVWAGPSIKFGTKVFGDFTIKLDTVPPKITQLKTVGRTIYYKMTDNLSGIYHWYGYLNGKFLLLHYDAKYNIIFTDPQEDTYIRGELLIGAVDNMGNATEVKFRY